MRTTGVTGGRMTIMATTAEVTITKNISLLPHLTFSKTSLQEQMRLGEKKW